MYYRVACIDPSESIVEQFFSVSGYITSGKRSSTGTSQTSAVSMQHLWGKFTKVEMDDEELENEAVITEGLREMLTSPQMVG